MLFRVALADRYGAERPCNLINAPALIVIDMKKAVFELIFRYNSRACKADFGK